MNAVYRADKNARECAAINTNKRKFERIWRGFCYEVTSGKSHKWLKNIDFPLHL